MIHFWQENQRCLSLHPDLNHCDWKAVVTFVWGLSQVVEYLPYNVLRLSIIKTLSMFSLYNEKSQLVSEKSIVNHLGHTD